MMKGSILIIISLYLFSCQQTQECNLAETIFAKPNPDSSLMLELQHLWGSTDSIYNIICESDLNAVFLNVNEKYFPFSNPDFLTMCSDVIYCGPPRRRDRVEVLINSENDILMEREIVNIGEIDSFFQEIYLNPSQNPEFISRPNKSIIDVKWDLRADKSKVASVIHELGNAYVHSLKSLYSKVSENEQCLMVSKRWDSLRFEYPFHLQLTFGEHFTLGGSIPPPPPPNWVD